MRKCILRSCGVLVQTHSAYTRFQILRPNNTLGGGGGGGDGRLVLPIETKM